MHADLEYIGIQAIGIIAFAIAVFSFLQSSDNKLRFYMGVYGLILAIHLYLLGGVFGALGSLIASTRMFVSMHEKGVYSMPLFLSFYLYLLFINDGHWIEYVPIIAGIMGTVFTFSLSGITLRFGYLSGQALWLSYNIYHISIGGVLLEFFNIFANGRTIRKMYTGKDKHE